jgi:hypothetical protein
MGATEPRLQRRWYITKVQTPLIACTSLGLATKTSAYVLGQSGSAQEFSPVMHRMPLHQNDKAFLGDSVLTFRMR